MNRPKNKMSQSERAKQFAPFSALNGLYEALAEKEKIVVEKSELSDEMSDEINQKLCFLEKGKMTSVIYFSDGEYLKVNGMVSDIDKQRREMTVVGTKIKFCDIYRIEM